jgi:hypothetical protein
MGKFWQIFKQELKNEWHRYEKMGSPRQSSGTGGTTISTGGTGSGGEPIDQWELVYQKFREIEGRDPYSFQELVDWWNRI